MSLEDYLTVRTASGAECIACDKPTRKGETVLAFGYTLKMGFLQNRFDWELHVNCADDLRILVERRIEQARVGEKK